MAKAIVSYRRDDGADCDALPVRLARAALGKPADPEAFEARTLSVDAAARMCGVGVWTVRRWVRLGMLECSRLPRRAKRFKYSIPRSALQAFINQSADRRFPGAASRLEQCRLRQFTIQAAATVLGLDRSTVNYHVLAGNIAADAAFSIPGQGLLRFSLRDLADFLLREDCPRKPFAGRGHDWWTPQEDARLVQAAGMQRPERLKFLARQLPDRSPDAIKGRLMRLRRRRPYFVTPHAIDRYVERVDSNAGQIGDDAVVQHILNELQHARFLPDSRKRHAPDQLSRISMLSHWPHAETGCPLIAVCRRFRAVVEVPSGAGLHPAVATIWPQLGEE